MALEQVQQKSNNPQHREIPPVKELKEHAEIKEIDGKKVIFIGARSLDDEMRPNWEKREYSKGPYKTFPHLKDAMYCEVEAPSIDPRGDKRRGFHVRTVDESQLYFLADQAA